MPLHGEEEGDAHTELTGSAHLRSHIGSLLPTTRQHRGSREGTVRSNCQDRDDPVHGLLGGPSEICSGGWVRGVLGRSDSILSPLFLPLGVLHFDLCCTTHIREWLLWLERADVHVSDRTTTEGNPTQRTNLEGPFPWTTM